jgi:xanthine dehydrogenase small subunit
MTQMAPSSESVVFELNGQNVIVDDVDPHCTLLEWLRASGRTGAKEGCAEGECGACAVAFISRDELGKWRYEAVNSCLVALPEAHGRAVVSVEGLASASGPLHPVQQAMLESGGSQCGYCTPGFVMSLFAEYYRPGRDGYDPEAISGNLCRCTGYRPIIDAARRLAPAPADDRWLAAAAARPVAALPPLAYCPEPGPKRQAAIGAPARRFLRPESLEAVFEALERHPGSVLLAGGTDLMVASNQRQVRYPTLLSLAAVPELQRVEWHAGEVVLGAGISLSRIERELQGERGAAFALLHELLPLFSSRLIRNRATLGGNLATASPIGDGAPALLALGAELSLASARGRRRLPLSEFFTGYRQTALLPGELIECVHLPRPLPRLQRFYKVSKRVMDDISSVAAAFTIELDGAGRVERSTFAYGGIAAVPLRAFELERLAAGRTWDAETVAELVCAARQLGTPLSDHRASADYRRAMVGNLIERFHADTARAAQAAG